MRWLWLGLLVPVLLVGSGLLLADHLTPPATGAPAHALPPVPDQTPIDRELAPLLAREPGRTGVLLLSDGLDAFAARAMAARRAGRSLDLQYYIWNDDFTGRLLAREVHAAAERGVRVRLLLDDLNARGLDPKWLALDAHPLIEIRLYNPFRNRGGIWRLVEMVQRVFSINHRMHNKAWIADGRVAVVGGRNIGEEYFAADAEVNFRDLDLLLFGPAVEQASTIFDGFWNSDAVVPIAALHRMTPQELRQAVNGLEDEAGLERASPYLRRVVGSRGMIDYHARALEPFWTGRLLVASDPPRKRGGDRDRWLLARLMPLLADARASAWLISPYFVPGEAGTAGLLALVEHGVQVGVATNSLAANDVAAVHSGYMRYRVPLLRGGVQLHELRASPAQGNAGLLGSSGASLHTKAFVVDGRFGFVGSFNLDPRSANLNTEMGVLFDDPAIAAAVKAEYDRLVAPEQSYEVVLAADGGLRWRDATADPPLMLDREPHAPAWLRATTRVLGWLPLESQL
ncbi:phospholipase D family protein [Lysobacter sp. GX 14042]|uniref:phospholipase D family protein n=1 Tax=Lysobacter sp. GX 14042 TaxID=2907155 RepID=UPI001F48F341|nr:phospholipase D family protein [Lysobacter sp. GX 14042]MCE7032959.1 phospholipase D family protein [Lysobacter sp. GX 14042]